MLPLLAALTLAAAPPIHVERDVPYGSLPEQTLDATTDPVVVRLHRSRASSLVYELDEALVNDRPHEVVIHRVTAETLPSEVPVQLR